MELRNHLIPLMCVMVLAGCIAGGNPGRIEAQPAESVLKKVTFTFAPTEYYEQVFLAGTFNGWRTDATPMTRKDDRFEVTLFLAKGEYMYKFVADGQWITDMEAEKFHPDGYGGQNSVIVVDDSFEDFATLRGDSHIMLEGLRHRDEAWERSLNTDGTVTIRLRTWTGDLEIVDLCREEGGGSDAATAWKDFVCERMGLIDRDGTYDYYAVTVGARDFVYYFRLADGDLAVILDRQGAREEPSGGLNLFRLDVSAMVPFSTPDWVKEGIIYQIFPERFANGNKENDPDFSEWYYEGLTQLPPSGKTNGEYFHLKLLLLIK